jgi:DNA polymerase-3 subunit beta
MKFHIQREALSSLIGKIQGVVPSKAVIPILANVLIEAKDYQIIVTTTDLTVSLRSSLEATVIEEGSIALPARRFFQLIRELKAPEIKFETDSNNIAIVTSGSSHFKINGLDKSEFPIFPEIKGGRSFNLSAARLKEMLVNTSFAAAKDDTRQVLNGICMELSENKLVVVGTDGKKLAKIEETIDDQIDEKQSSIIPLKAVEEMCRLLDDEDSSTTLTLMSDKIALETHRSSLVSKLLSGQFPDYQRVLPNRSNMHQMHIHRDELMTLLRQVSLFTSEASHSVKLSFENGELKLQAVNSEIGEGKVNMPVDYHEQKLDIAFNPHYFIDILRHCKDETVSFGITDSFNPGSITDTSNAHFVLMPMRLSSE